MNIKIKIYQKKKKGTHKILALNLIFLFLGIYNLLHQQLQNKNIGYLVFSKGILHLYYF